MNHLDFSKNPVNFNLTLGHWAGRNCLRDQCSEGDEDSLIVKSQSNQQSVCFFYLLILIQGLV